MNNRFGWLDSLRGFAMIAIVLGHPMHTSPALGELLYSFHVPLFFIVSGALLRPEKYQSIKYYAKHQFNRIIVPYIILYTICIALWYLNWKVLADSATSTKLVLGGVYTANQTIVPMANGALWFLPVLYLTSIVSFQVARTAKTRGSLFFVSVCFLVVGLLLIRLFPQPLPWTINIVPVAIFYYLSGYILMPFAIKVCNSIHSECGHFTFWKGALLGVAIAGLGFYLGYKSYIASGQFLSLMRCSVGQVPMGICGALVISIGLALIAISIPRIRFLEWYGRTTMGTLAFHVPVMRFLENISALLAFQVDPLLIGILTVILVIPINTYLYKHASCLFGL